MWNSFYLKQRTPWGWVILEFCLFLIPFRILYLAEQIAFAEFGDLGRGGPLISQGRICAFIPLPLLFRLSNVNSNFCIMLSIYLQKIRL